MKEEKLKVLKEIKDEKSSFFNRFFDYLEKKNYIKSDYQICFMHVAGVRISRTLFERK